MIGPPNDAIRFIFFVFLHSGFGARLKRLFSVAGLEAHPRDETPQAIKMIHKTIS
jgi:hypothetical protein